MGRHASISGRLLHPPLKHILSLIAFVHAPTLEYKTEIHPHSLAMTTSVRLVILLLAAEVDTSLPVTHFLMVRDVDQQAPAVPSTTHHGFPNNYPQLPLTTLKYECAVMNVPALMMSPSRSLNCTFNRQQKLTACIHPLLCKSINDVDDGSFLTTIQEIFLNGSYAKIDLTVLYKCLGHMPSFYSYRLFLYVGVSLPLHTVLSYLNELSSTLPQIKGNDNLGCPTLQKQICCFNR